MTDEIKEETKEEVKETKEPDLSRREAIEKGIKDLESKKEKKEEEPKETEESEEDEDSKEELEAAEKEEDDNAIKLFRALNDPEQGPKILRILAQEAGVLDKGNTKEEKKEALKSIKQVVREKLGTEYQFLADKIGDILEEIVPQANKKDTEDLKARIDARDKLELSNQIDSALADCFGQYNEVPKAVQVRFNELIDEMPPVPGKTIPKVYFNRLIKIAAEETKTTLKFKDSSKSSSQDIKNNDLAQTIKDRVARNKRDVTSQLTSKGAEAEVEDTSKSTSKPPKSRREAIERAARDVAAAMK